jgi:ABC-2 type transport system permease protein
MSALVSAELLKLRTTRTALGFLIATVLLTLLAGAATFATTDVRSPHDLQQAFSGAGITGLLLLILGIVATTGEYRHRTITGALLVTPDRRRFLVGKLIAYLLTGAVLGAVAIAVTIVPGLIWFSIRDQPIDLLSAGDYVLIVLRGIGLCALSGSVGVAIGMLVRNQIAAVVGLLLYLFIVETLIGVASEDVAKFMLGAVQSTLDGNGAPPHALAPGVAALVLAGWVVLLAAAGMALDQRRDVT